MAYYVKKCTYCGAETHPSESSCLKCFKDLPNVKIESESEPLTRPKSAPAIGRRPTMSQDGAYDSPENNTQPQAIRVIVTDIDMKFGSIVNLMVKWAIATIPALIILIIFGALALAALSGLGVFFQTR